MEPVAHYAKTGDASIAYQVIGEGPFDLVYVSGWISNIELMWEEPGHARFLNRLVSFCQAGWSADYPWAPTPEQRQRWYDQIKQGLGGSWI